MGGILHSDCTCIEKYLCFLYFLLIFPKSSNYFWSTVFVLSSILSDEFLYGKIVIHLAGNCLRKCSWTDLKSKYLSLKISKPSHLELSLYNRFKTPLLCLLLSETVYCIWFCQKRSCLQIGISLLWLPVLNFLDIHKLMFEYVHICMHAKGSMWPFWHNLENYPLLWMYSPYTTCKST